MIKTALTRVRSWLSDQADELDYLVSGFLFALVIEVCRGTAEAREAARRSEKLFAARAARNDQNSGK